MGARKKISEMSRGELRKLRYRDGFWIDARKRVYLYWFKFLQHAERSADYTVDWSRYDGWGGADEVLTSKFDAWWEAHWQELFGVRSEGETARYSVSSKAKADGIRYALLVYEADDGQRTNYEIAEEILRKNKRAGYLLTFGSDKDVVQSVIGRYKRTAHQYLANVCVGNLI